jgi:hypothetical protein
MSKRKNTEAQKSEAFHRTLDLMVLKVPYALGPQHGYGIVRRQFCKITSLKEANREMRGIRFIDPFIQDARYCLTMLRRIPGFT